MNRFLKASLPLIFAACALVFPAPVRAQVAGQNVNMVSGTSWPGGDPFLQRQNEPSMAVSTRNPRHILAGANDYRTVDLELAISGGAETGDAWLGLFKSFDGGLTWRSTLLPGCPYADPQCTDTTLGGTYQAGADPVVRAGTNGMFYYAGLAFDRPTSNGASSISSIFVARYVDLNNNENTDPIAYIDTHLVASGDSSKFLDKPAMAVDIPRSGALTCSFSANEPGVGSVPQSFAAGNVYMSYTDFGKATKDNATPTRLMFSRSTDCGVTWSTPVQLNTGTTTSQGSAIAVNALSGNVYVTWRQFKSSGPNSVPDAIMIAQSKDAGRTFSAPVRISTFTPFDQGTTDTSIRTNAYPSIATDMFGFVYVAFSAKGLVASGDARVVATGSIDATHWTPPIMVDNPAKNAQTNPSGRGHQIMPAITFANGRLTLLYYDLRLDHYENVYTSAPKTPTGYTSVLTPEGELPGSPNAVFTPFIDDLGLTMRRHTLDLRLLELGIFPTITLGPSVLVSQYAFGCCVDPNSKTIEQFKFNVPNLPIFGSGHLPFLGDYIDIVPSPAFVPNGTSWVYNFKPSVNPLFHATWTDNRDVVPPSPPNSWLDYTPAIPIGTRSLFNPGSTVRACVKGQGNEGMRNQNIYTAQITGGLIAGAKGNFKPLGTTIFPENSTTTVPFQRAFAVEAQNVTSQPLNVRFTIANQPSGGKASFLQFSLRTTLDVTIPAFSSVSRSVFVTSTNAQASVTVNVVQIGSIGGSPVNNGLSSSATLNPDVTNPNITNPNVTNPNVTNPDITNYEVTNPNVSNPNITNPNVTNPNITNPNITNPNVTNPNITNPNVTNVSATNPNITNPNITNPNITNPNITNPNITNPNVTNGSIQDVIYPITNTGNTTATYTVKVATTLTPPNGVLLQLILNKLYETPNAIECQLTTETHWETVANIVAPKLYAANDPQLGNPNVTNSTPNEASVTLAPGETAYITLRVVSPDKNHPINPLTYFTPVTVPQAVNTTTALANPGGILPTPTVPALIITTPSLPDSIPGQNYNATVAATGGNPGSAYTFSIAPDSTLPANLSLNSATGAITGSPAATGTFTFSIQVKDTATGVLPQHTTVQAFTIHVVAPLNLNPPPFEGTTPLTGGTQGTPYNQAISAVGGLAPVTISLISGSVPAGLSFNNGAITGTPTATGISTFTVRATDNSNPHQVLTVPYSINIVSANAGNGNVTFVKQPPNYVGGQTNPNSPIQVHVQDNQGAAIANANVVMSFNGTPPCGAATLSGTLTQQTSETGDAFFSNLSVDRGQIGYSLTATVTVAGAPPASANSNLFTVNGFCATGNSAIARNFPTATLLPNGTVLVAGGANDGGPAAVAQAEIYSPTNGTFNTLSAHLIEPRTLHTATLLNNGTVLLVGGQSSTTFLGTAEIYVNGTFTTVPGATGHLTTPRSSHTATLLADGSVLIAGGITTGNSVLASAELYNPVSKTFTPVGNMHIGRENHTATLLDNGMVLIAGGFDNSAELYDPVAKTFTNTGVLSTARQSPSATLLPNGQVLVAGGLGSNGTTAIGTAELYNPGAGTFSLTGALNAARGGHTGTLLTDGTVLLAGGFNLINPSISGILASAEIYNPSTSNFSNTGSLTGTRWQHTATLLNDGSLLIAGGFGFNSNPQVNQNTLLATADRYFSTAPLSPIAFTTPTTLAAGQPATSVFSSPSAFNGAATNLTPVGFNGILNGANNLDFNPLTVSAINFSTPTEGTFVNVTKSTFYTPTNYPADFIIDSSNPSPSNQLVITLPQPTRALGLDYGGFSGASAATLTLSNGFTLPLASLPTLGNTQFSGFVSATPFSTLTFTTTNDSWVVLDLLLGTANTALPSATEGIRYTHILLEQGGVGPLTWSLANGTQSPTGLNLNSNGILTGTPTASGLYTFAVKLMDSSNPPKTVTSGNLTMSIVPQPPSNVSSGAVSSSSATIIWEFSLSTDVTGYNVYRANTSVGPYTKVGSAIPTAFSFTDNTVQTGTTYYYVVTASGNSSVESVNSNQATVVVP